MSDGLALARDIRSVFDFYRQVATASRFKDVDLIVTIWSKAVSSSSSEAMWVAYVQDKV